MSRPSRSGTPSILPFFAPATPRVLAHRGLADGAPENTLLAFLKALAAGVLYLETDVHASRDGIAVICHDPDLTRLVGRPERVSDLSLSELKEIRLGEGQTFASLAEALDAFPQARFNIDIKSPDAIEGTVAAIRAAGAEDRVLITSFSESRRSAAMRELPRVATSASASVFVLVLLAAKLGLNGAVRWLLRGVHALQIPERMYGIQVLTPRTLAAFQGAGVEVHIWTVNDRATMERLLDLGVDGLVTDHADVAVRLIESRTLRNP